MAAYDEFWMAEGIPRPHQKLLRDFVARHSQADLQGIERSVAARVHEQEVSYNILGTPDGSERPWQLDPLPHVMDADEFTVLSRSLAQRARLIRACLADIYGEQRLLREQIVPPELVLGNPHYFRPLQGFEPVGGSRMVLYGADVIRDSEGRFLVQSDRTGAPAGSGYALENRLAIGQALAEPFRGYRVRKINRFFEFMREAVGHLATEDGRPPRIVLLTPGLHDESSFEHAYLSRYQGIELVEGRDLTVRGQEVFLKTLGGLKRVDVILRRVSDDWCDPLELREDSMQGVAGLVGAARSGSVALVNPLGSSIMESSAMRAYLPQMSRALLGEELLLQSVTTVHLLDPDKRALVFNDIEDWIIKPAYSERRVAPQALACLSVEERNNLIKRISEAPERFVAEKWPLASRVPIGLYMRTTGALSMRFFGCQSGEDYEIMRGGLARVDSSPDGLFLGSDQESLSKDLWIVGKDGDDQHRLPAMPEVPLALRRGGVDLPSRLFDDIYWLGRYVERVNGTASLLRAGLEPIATEGLEIRPEVADGIMKSLIGLQIITPRKAATSDLQRALLASIYDLARPNSIRACLGRIHDLTTATRSRLSRDAWGTLRRLSGAYQNLDQGQVSPDRAVEGLNDLLMVVSAVHGIASSNMVRGHAWIFLELGRRVERSVYVLSLLSQLFPRDGSRVLMETLLSICDSLLTYRSRYLSTLQAAPVVDLVLTDETNPQSVLFQIRRLLECVRALPREQRFPLSRAEQRLITVEARLLTADLYKACSGSAGQLRELAEDGVNMMWQVSDDLTQTYFTHAGRSRAMAPPHWIGEDLEAL